MSIVVHSSTVELSVSDPRAVFGLPAYNHGHKLGQTLDSLLSQTLPNFRVIISDDCSTDETPQIIREYAGRDKRLILTRTARRLGYIANARRCFELAREQFPSAEYFAWASDHDIWHPCWLEILTLELDEHPDAVIACPNVYRIDGDGEILAAKPARCIAGKAASAWQFSKIFAEITPGNMIYGLMRADALEKAGVLPWHIMPDRLILMLLSLYGSVLSVPEYLWYRRYRGLASLKRQKQSSFFGVLPSYLYFPWWMTHAAHIFNRFVITPGAGEPIGRLSGAGYALLYALLGVRYVLARRLLHPIKRSFRTLAPMSYASMKDKYRRAPKAAPLVKSEHHWKVR